MFVELKKRFQAQAVWRKTMRQLIRVSMSDNASPLSANVMIKRALSQTVIGMYCVHVTVPILYFARLSGTFKTSAMSGVWFS